MSNEGLGARDASACRHGLNETSAKGERDRGVPLCSEAREAVGLTGLMGGVYAEALGVRQVLAGELEAKQTNPEPDTNGCVN